jgi:tetratricopeptide (TPR) repeat protein
MKARTHPAGNGQSIEEGLETMTFPPVRTSIGRRAGAVAAVIALAVALGACSSSGKPGATGICSSAAAPGKPGTTTAKYAKDTATILNTGLSKQRAGNIADAEKDFKTVIKRDPNNKYAYYDIGLICQNQQKNAEAETAYRRSIAIDPKFEVALYNLAIVRANANDVNGAIDLYRRAIASNAKDPNAHYNLGLLLRGQGNKQEGNAEVQTAVNLDPTLRPKAISEGVPLTGS